MISRGDDKVPHLLFNTEKTCVMKNQKAMLLERLHLTHDVHDLGLYVHIPFCKKRCHFCAFYLAIHQESRVQGFLSALEKEISFYSSQARCHDFPLSSIYFGGGTPTALRSEQLVEIIRCIQRHFRLSSSLEMTVEADPETVDLGSLQVLSDAGVNRLSFGVQSLDESEWKQLGRSGAMSMVEQAITMAKDIGYSNISLDLMYGLPGQTLRSWQCSLEEAIALQPTHISCYALTIEEGTRFHREQERGILKPNDWDLETAMQDQTINGLRNAGYRQYEVSNFAHVGFECQHNLRYWSGLDYLGLGPSAQSYVAKTRFGNIADLSAYSHAFENQEWPLDAIDFLSTHESAREHAIFGLRMNQGVPLHVLRPLAFDRTWQSTVGRLVNSGLLIQDHNHLKATTKGRQFMDDISLQLMP